MGIIIIPSSPRVLSVLVLFLSLFMGSSIDWLSHGPAGAVETVRRTRRQGSTTFGQRDQLGPSLALPGSSIQEARLYLRSNEGFAGFSEPTMPTVLTGAQ